MHDITEQYGELIGFPNDDKIWRLDWYGWLYRDSSVLSDPQICLSFSSIRDRNAKRFHNSAVSNEVIRDARVGISLLPILPLGSLWHKGKMIEALNGNDETETFYITIPHTATEQFIKIKDIVSLDQYRFSVFDKVRCVIVPVNGKTTQLIIPCNEIFRFYYASSGAIAKTLLTSPQLEKDLVLLKDPKTGKNRTGKLADGSFIITLRKKFPNTDAWTISRILGNTTAGYEAKRIHNSVAVANANGSGLYIEVGFPFIGNTQITASGKWVRCLDEVWRFLVMNLSYCSHPFPYDRVIVARETGKAGTEKRGDKPFNLSLHSTKENTKANSKDKPPIRSDIEPDSDTQARIVVVPDNRFAFLTDKKLVANEQEISEYCNSRVMNTPTIKQFEAPGDGFGKSNASRVDFKVDNAEKEGNKVIPAYFNFLVDAFRLLGIPWEVISLENSTRCRETALSTFPRPKNARSNAWVFIDKKTERLRKALWIEAIYGDKYFYFVEWERERDGYGIHVLSFLNGRQVGFAEIAAIMRRWARSQENRTTRGINQFGWLKVDSINHYDNDTLDRISTRIISSLRVNISQPK